MAQQTDMKLYTEEQVRSAMYLSDKGDYDTYSRILNQFTPIELPSDEEIEKHSTVLLYEKYPHHPTSDTGYWKDMFFEGAKWMKEQILNQNK